MGLIGLSFFVMMTLFHLWDLPGDVLAAPESASGLDRCNLSLSLSLNDTMNYCKNLTRVIHGNLLISCSVLHALLCC